MKQLYDLERLSAKFIKDQSNIEQLADGGPKGDDIKVGAALSIQLVMLSGARRSITAHRNLVHIALGVHMLFHSVSTIVWCRVSTR